MKKLFFVLLAIISFCTVNAQRYDFAFGPKFGLNVSGVSNWEGNAKASIHGGLFAEFRFTELFAFQPEVLYSRQGTKDGDLYNRVNYLNVPLLARLYVFDRLSVDLGPQVGFVLKSKQKYKDNGTTYKQDIDDINKVDVAFAVGLSYDIWERFMVSARYNIGLTNVVDKDKNNDDNNKNQVFQLSVGYKFY